MADLLSTGVSGLLASQLNLTTIGNNIANASTPGYSRETVQQTENLVQQANARYTIGSGVNVVSVRRAYSQYLTQALWNSNTGLQGASTYNDLAGTLNNLLSSSGDLRGALDTFYGNISDVANAPGDTATRQSLLGSAQSAATVFNTLGQQLDQQQTQVNNRIQDTVTSINTTSAQIAQLNKQIAESSNNGNSPNGLLDQRDSLVKQLAGLTGITTMSEKGGAIGIFTSSGQPLVSEAQSFALRTAPNAYDAARTDVFDGNGYDITGHISDGTLGALFSYRSVLDSAQNQLGRSAVALAGSINAQQAKGLDLNGNQGKPLFSIGQPQVLGNHGNTGSASVSASISDLSTLTSSDYVLRYAGPGNGTNGWTLTTTGGQSVALTANASGTLSADGLTFSVAGSAQVGDSYQILPTRDAATSLGMAMTDPGGIAAASAVAASPAASNSGATQVTSAVVTDPANPNLLNAATIRFGAGGSYTVTNGVGTVLTSGSYVAGQPISANGWSVTLGGTPVSGDSFNVGANSNGLDDNSNALAMAKLSDGGVLDGGQTSVVASYAGLTTQIGTIGSQAKASFTTQTSLSTQANDAQQSAAGVNLDEEAANLVKYQQAYAASAKVISTAQSLLTTLLNAFN